MWLAVAGLSCPSGRTCVGVDHAEAVTKQTVVAKFFQGLCTMRMQILRSSSIDHPTSML